MILILLLTNVLVDARFGGVSKIGRERRNCILYDLPSKTFCDKKYPNRVSAKAYYTLRTEMAILYITIIIGILLVSTYC